MTYFLGAIMAAGGVAMVFLWRAYAERRDERRALFARIRARGHVVLIPRP